MKNSCEKIQSKSNFSSKLDFGMPTLIELNSIKENVELCKELNLNFIELNMNMPYCALLGYNEKDDSVKSELDNFISELKDFQKSTEFILRFQLKKFIYLKNTMTIMIFVLMNL